MTFSPEDQRHLDAAEGWLGLGSLPDANEELERISPELQAHPDVLQVRWGIHAHAKQWEMAAELARQMSVLQPETSLGCIQWAFSLHELKRTREALEVLLPVADKFPRDYIIQYNLSCYYCQLGQLPEAYQRLGKAIQIAHGKVDVRKMALDDPDLEPLRSRIREI